MISHLHNTHEYPLVECTRCHHTDDCEEGCQTRHNHDHQHCELELTGSFRYTTDADLDATLRVGYPRPDVSLIDYRRNNMKDTARKKIEKAATADKKATGSEVPTTDALLPSTPSSPSITAAAPSPPTALASSSTAHIPLPSTSSSPTTTAAAPFPHITLVSSSTGTAAETGMSPLSVALVEFFELHPNCKSSASQVEAILRKEDLSNFEMIGYLTREEFKVLEGMEAMSFGCRINLYNFLVAKGSQ